MTFSADLREVWKRLAADSVMVPMYGDGGPLSTEWMWAQRVTQQRAFLGFWWPSAMQGCRE